MTTFMGSLYIYYKYKIFKPTDNFHYLLKYYPEDFILKLGGRLKNPEERLQYFLNFPLEKKKKTIRIGAFGDSRTFGDEVDKKSSYPYHLQQLFNKFYPNHNIEVFNLGVSGAGFQEQFFLWEKYAKLYKLDYILLGPSGFHQNRDVTFVKPWDNNLPPKNRFILTKKNQLREVHIKGESIQERHKNYYRFFPAWTTLRYDKFAFMTWERLIPNLRHKIKNPFYYKKISSEQESFQINKILLKNINEKYNKKILFLTDSKYTYKIYSSLKNLYNLNSMLNTKNFYKVFSHKSSLGNEFIANIYFHALRGKTNLSVPFIKCYFKESNNSSPLHTLDLKSVKKIQIMGKDTVLLNLRPNNPRHHYLYKEDHLLNYGLNFKSLISFTNKNNFMRGPFIPLNIQLKEGMSIYLDKKIKLGEIKSLDSYNNFFIFLSDYVEIAKKEYYDSYYPYFYLKDYKMIKAFMKSKNKELFVEDYKIGTLVFTKLSGEKLLKLVPEIDIQRTFLMMGAQTHTTERDFPKEFPIYIKYYTNQEEIFKSLIPEWQCKKELKKIHLDLPNFEAIE